MASNFPGSGRIQYTASWPTVGAFAFRFKSTYAGAGGMGVLSQWSSSSRNGPAMILGNVTNKLLAQAYGSNSGAVGYSWLSAGNVNDGLWHSVNINYNTGNGQPNAYYIDGNLEQSGNSGASWPNSASNPLILGDLVDAFWANYNGDLADVAWWNRQLTIDEINTYAQGGSPLLIAPTKLVHYDPLIGIPCNLVGAAPTVTGTTRSDHPRVFCFE